MASERGSLTDVRCMVFRSVRKRPVAGIRSSPSRSVGEGEYWVGLPQAIQVQSGGLDDPALREAVVEGSGLALPFDVANPSVSPAGCHLPFAPREEDL